MKTIDHYPLFAHDKRGVGLIFALVCVVLLSVIMTVFYEIVIPRSKNVKGIEESNVAAYQAESGIEASLMMMSGATPVTSVQSGITAGNRSYSSTGIVASVCSSGICTFPEAGKGNSPTNSGAQILRSGVPLQVRVDESILSFSVKISLPSFSGSTNSYQLQGGATDFYTYSINMGDVSITLKSASGLTFTDGSYTQDLLANTATGITNTGAEVEMDEFFTGNKAKCGSYKCSVKLSLLKPLILTNNDVIPYLEYSFETNASVPLQFVSLTSTGKSGPFTKVVDREIERFTTNEAFDFTLLQ